MRKQINVPLTVDEFVRLREVATNECRDPREQARYLVRVGLGLVAGTDAKSQPGGNRAPAAEAAVAA